MDKPSRVLLTGGGGFLGQYICRALKAAGYDVVSYSRQYYPALERSGVCQVQGDLCDTPALTRALQGCDAMVHTAAKAGVWGPYASYHRTNVLGTRSALQAAQNQGIKRFVYTSTPSVVFNGHDIRGGDESLPYTRRQWGAYAYSKMLAEAEVLAAHGRDGMAVVALRPHLIWGPGDPHFMPRLAELGRKDRLRIIGDGSNRVDVIYVENAAEAHVRALEALTLKAPHAGKAYFLGQNEEVKLWDFLNQLLAVLGLPPVTRRLPLPVAYTLAALCEGAFKALGPFLADREPPLTRFASLQMARSHYFDHRAAKRDFGYEPRISTAEGLQHLQHFFAASPQGLKKP